MKNHISVCWIASKLLGWHLQMLLVLSHSTKTRSPIAPRLSKFTESRFRCLLVEPVELVQQGTTWVLLYQSLPLLRGTLWLWLPPCTLQSTRTIQHRQRLLRLSLVFEKKNIHASKVWCQPRQHVGTSLWLFDQHNQTLSNLSLVGTKVSLKSRGRSWIGDNESIKNNQVIFLPNDNISCMGDHMILRLYG